MAKASARGALALAFSLLFPVPGPRAADGPAAAGERRSPTKSAWEKADYKEGFALDNPTYSDKQNFGYAFENTGFRDCDGFPYLHTIPVNYTFGQPMGATTAMEQIAGFGKRKFLRDPVVGLLYLLDEINLSPKVGLSQRILNVSPQLPFSMFGSAQFSGDSSVARPLPSRNSCEQIRTFLKVTNFKTVLPLTAKRISAMIPGEIWRVPVSFTIQIGPSGGYAYAGGTSANYLNGSANPALLEGLNFIFSASVGTSKSATLTFRRLDEDTLRVRVRLGRVTMQDVQGNAFASVPVIQMVQAPIQAALAAALPRSMAGMGAAYVAQQLLLAVTSTMTFDRLRTSGDTVTLEYILDPRDASQMKALAKMARGDLNVFKQLVRFKVRDALHRRGQDSQAQEERLADLEQKHSQVLKTPPSYAGLAASLTKAMTLKASTPIVLQFSRVRTRESDRYVVQEPHSGRKQRFDVRSAQLTKSYGIMNFPFLGAVMTRNRNKRVQSIVYQGPGGEAQDPSLLYLSQVAGMRHARRLPRKELERVNALMSHAGTLRGSGGSRMQIPPPDILPDEKSPIKKFTSNFTLYLSSTGVDQVLSAGRDEILEAFRGILPAPQDGEGRLAKLKHSLRQRRLQRQATRFVSSTEAARAAPDKAGRAASLIGIWDGPRWKRWKRMNFEDALNVFLQLADPTEVAAEFIESSVAKINSGSRESSRFVLNPKLFEDPVLRDLSETKSRYIPPQPLSD